MNIISGIARGIKLNMIKGLEIRPTSAAARKSIFDSIRFWDDLIVVDLFAGAGSLGLEAASRGAKSVTLVEINNLHCKIISENIEKVKKSGVEADMNVMKASALSAHKLLPNLSGKIDIILADPPYKDCAKAMKEITSNKDFAIWAKEAMLVFEAPNEKNRKPDYIDLNNWTIDKIKKKGQSDFYFLKSNTR